MPGQNNGMLDRAQLQYMFFGCCTLSPILPEILPYQKQFIPNVHYVPLQDDYSDLYEKIEWVKQNRRKCIKIGYNAKELCKENLNPVALVRWIKENI